MLGHNHFEHRSVNAARDNLGPDDLDEDGATTEATPSTAPAIRVVHQGAAARKSRRVAKARTRRHMDDVSPPAGSAPVPGLDPAYRASRDGTIWYWHSYRGKWVRLRQSIHENGFRGVRVRTAAAKCGVRGVGSLILRTFVGPRPLGHQVLHFPNSDPANNAVDNLRWAPIEAFRDHRDKGNFGPPRRGSAVHGARLTESDIPTIRDLYRTGSSMAEIGERFGVTQPTVRLVLVGRSWAHIPDPLGPVVIRSSARRGEDGPGAKLNAEEVAEIRRLQAGGVRRKDIAALFGVSVYAIHNIVRGRSWRDG
jgi:hypothetical protein